MVKVSKSAELVVTGRTIYRVNTFQLSLGSVSCGGTACSFSELLRPVWL